MIAKNAEVNTDFRVVQRLITKLRKGIHDRASKNKT